MFQRQRQSCIQHISSIYIPPRYKRQHYSIHIPDKVEEIFIVTKRIILKLPYLLFLQLFLPWHCVTGVSSVIDVLAAVRIIRCQVCPADGTFQHIEARDTRAVRDAPPAVHPADRRMLAGEILL